MGSVDKSHAPLFWVNKHCFETASWYVRTGAFVLLCTDEHAELWLQGWKIVFKEFASRNRTICEVLCCLMFKHHFCFVSCCPEPKKISGRGSCVINSLLPCCQEKPRGSRLEFWLWNRYAWDGENARCAFEKVSKIFLLESLLNVSPLLQNCWHWRR